MDTLLFIGDSITDAGRLFSYRKVLYENPLLDAQLRAPNKNCANQNIDPQGVRSALPFSDRTDGLGEGYVSILADALNGPANNYRIINKGHDGFTLPRIIHNLSRDCFSCQPDMVTILAGNNDAAICMNNGLTLKDYKFADYYEQLLLSILENTSARIVCMGPFLFPHPQEYQNWLPLVHEINQRIKELAQKYRLPFIYLQKLMCDKACEYGYSKITVDGVHLTSYGHQLAANAWLEGSGLT